MKAELLHLLRRKFIFYWGDIHGSPHWVLVQLNGAADG
jgi:hypothetical protein